MRVVLQVWFQNARAKFRRNAVMNCEQQSPQPPVNHSYNHQGDSTAAALASGGGASSEDASGTQSVSVGDEVNNRSNSPSLVELHVSCASRPSVHAAAGYQRQLSPTLRHVSDPPAVAPALTDIIYCPPFTF